MNLAPIVLFVYNRLEHTKQTVETLQKNEFAKESELFIFSDAAKNENTEQKVNEVREYIKTIDGFKKVTIIEREKNWGLANSIINGVTKIVNEYGKIIVLEDDLVTSPYFLKFMNEALEFYEGEKKVFTISGYSDIKIPNNYTGEVYFAHISTSWGWATWKKEWNTIDWKIDSYMYLLEDKKSYARLLKKVGKPRLDMLIMQKEGKIDSWAIRRLFSQLTQEKMTVFPSKSFVRNIGHDGTGVHCGKDSQTCVVELATIPISNFLDFYNNEKINKIIYKKNHNTFLKKITNKLKRIIVK